MTNKDNAMNSQRKCSQKISHRKLALIIGMMLSSGAIAEAPMNTDDAGTLDKGAMKIEGVWRRDDMTRGGELLFGFSPVKDLELEVVGSAAKETGGADNMLHGVGFGAKWVPYQNDTGWSLGARFDYGHTRVTDKIADAISNEEEYALTGLASYRLTNGQVLHLNIGINKTNAEGERDSIGTWSIGYEFTLMSNLQLTVETFGAEHTGPDKAIGLRYKIADGLKISGAIGHGNDRHFGQAGFSWEF
jgi:hypothetical protein